MKGSLQNKFNGYNMDTKLACEVKLEGNHFDILSIKYQCEDGLKRDKWMCLRDIYEVKCTGLGWLCSG